MIKLPKRVPLKYQREKKKSPLTLEINLSHNHLLIMILNFSHYLVICYIASQCSHKRVMILCDYRGTVKTKSNNDDEKISPLKDASDDEVR